MSETLLIVLSTAEVLALVVVLAVFLLVIARQLRSVTATLQEVTWGARAVERQLRAVGVNVSDLNVALEDTATTLPSARAKLERLAGSGSS